MYLWLPVIHGMTTLDQLRTVYTLDDLVDMHAALNYKHDIQAASEQDQRQ